MKKNITYRLIFISVIVALFCIHGVSGQFLLQAPSSTDENNYRWFNASDTNTVLSTDSFFEATRPGVYFATYDGTLCGSNATDYFILTDCNDASRVVSLDISANVKPEQTIFWTPTINGDQLIAGVVATIDPVRYTATIIKASNTKTLPSFTVVCLAQAADLVDDVVTVDEDSSVIIDIYANDNNLPNTGTLTTTDPTNGTVTIDDNGTPNNPADDIVTYTPDPDYNGPDSFDYTVCNSIGDCSTATVDITVIPIVDAIDDVVTTDENTPIDIDILSNDNDLPSAGTLTVTNPGNGTVTINDNGTPNDPSDDTVTYTPNSGFTGTDTFEYTICDNQGNCSTATVTIIVNPGVDLDTDNDGILDSFEDLDEDGDGDPATNPTDSDGDTIPDYLDIDSDDDGIPDNVEAQSTADYIPPSGIDANNNGLDDAYEADGNLGIIPENTDGTDLPDYLDSDSDNDNVPDNIEGHDANVDGIPDVVFTGSDKDNDGLDDGYEGEDQIDDDVNDEINNPINDLPNTDGDNESDYRDTDDDDDGIETSDEDVNGDGNFANDDTDEDGIPDYLDDFIIPLEDEVEVFNVITPNGDGIHDILMISGLENFPNNSINVYNRWGILVYSTLAYNTEGNVFDGTSQGRVTVDQDNKLPVGTYFYVLNYENATGNNTTLSGYIYINR